jgi:hypothetical protein
VPGGGFSWFGQAPANKILTAYGLMEFNDMSKVSDVDPRSSSAPRVARPPAAADGSWKPDTEFINEGATNRYNSDVLRITAYIAWSLANTGYQGAVEKAKHFIESHMARSRRLHAGRHRQLRRRLRQGSRIHRRPCRLCSTRARKRASRSHGTPKRPASTPPARAPR